MGPASVRPPLQRLGQARRLAGSIIRSKRETADDDGWRRGFDGDAREQQRRRWHTGGSKCACGVLSAKHKYTALAGDFGSDIGNVGRNILRGPGQINVDMAVAKRFRVRESVSVQFRADIFNVLNHRNPNNPVSDITTALGSGGSIDPNTGRLVSPGDFGRIIGSSSAPRIMQLSAKLSF